MSNGTILKLAALVGLVVAGWFLVTYEPPAEDRRPGSRRPTAADRIEQATAAIVASPTDGEGWRRLMHTLVDAEDPEARVDRWMDGAPESIGAAVPLRAYSWYWLGFAYEGRGERDEAVRSWKRGVAEFEAAVSASAVSEVSFWTWYRLGYAREQLGLSGECLEAYDSAMERLPHEPPSPGLARYCIAMGNHYAEKGDPERAIAAYRRWIDLRSRIRSDGADFFSRSGAIASLRGMAMDEQMHGALRVILADLVPLARDAASVAEIALLQLQVGDPEGARANWELAAETAEVELARERNPSFVSIYNLACYRARAGDRAGALEAWEQAVEAGWVDWQFAAEDPDLELIRADLRLDERIVPDTEP